MPAQPAPRSEPSRSQDRPSVAPHRSPSGAGLPRARAATLATSGAVLGEEFGVCAPALPAAVVGAELLCPVTSGPHSCAATGLILTALHQRCYQPSDFSRGEFLKSLALSQPVTARLTPPGQQFTPPRAGRPPGPLLSHHTCIKLYI